jgi:putative dimethyl sulfoxide reductase chaperone
MTQIIKNAEELRARAGWYRLLAGVFAEEPQVDFLRELRGDACQAALEELGVKFENDFLTTDLMELVDVLACEYTMLFIAPGGFPPVESVRLQGGFRQSAVTETKMLYAGEGFASKPGRFTTFDDHLAVELGFIAVLLEQQADALGSDDASEAKRLEKQIKRFWVQHLGRWVRGFSTLVEEASDHSFYREMAILLNAFADAELELFELDIVDGDGGRWRAPRPSEVDKPMQCGGG